MADESVRFLLLQVRNPDEPMLHQEVRCFARSFGCSTAQIDVFDLLSGAPAPSVLAGADIVLLGGSGDYSVARGGPWLPAALETMVRSQPDVLGVSYLRTRRTGAKYWVDVGIELPSGSTGLTGGGPLPAAPRAGATRRTSRIVSPTSIESRTSKPLRSSPKIV